SMCYQVVDAICINRNDEKLRAKLIEFGSEHTHDLEDEARLIVKGRGVFYLHLESAERGEHILKINVQAGDFVRIPKGMAHWFEIEGDQDLWAVRLIGDPEGYKATLTGSD